MRTTPIEGPEVWVGADLDADQSWTVDMSSELREEALAMLALIGDRPLDEIALEESCAPGLARMFDGLIDEIEGGRGVARVRGVPIDGLSCEQIERLCWALALHLGTPEAQDGAGKRLHHVRAERSFESIAAAKLAFRDTNLRGYQTNLELHFHGDGSDALFFLCARDARHGGSSRIVSAAATFNRVLERSSDLALALQEPYAFDTRGELGPERPFQMLPIFIEHAGRMNMLYKRGYIEMSQRLSAAPRPTARQLAAMDLLDEVLADPALYYEFKLCPGDILTANNYNVMHARTQFVDDPDPARGRHMLRIWLTLRRNRRPLPPPFRESREFGASYRRRLALGDPS